ncbi:ABC transporter substrate-binding protein [Mesorhizobium sp. M0046]|uniref:ABC transporter substrate-binding protein n=1 Tax=Mesorhizobium sp. M0046 TaxID=2956858 RepID=UPI00333A055C
MTLSRRDLIKVGLAAGTAVSIPSVLRAQTVPADARTVRMVLRDSISAFDPYYTTATITFNHACSIYDTLVALDSKGMPQPQMLAKWDVSDDKKTYTFELRDGLGWHDRAPVTAADCVASIRRWGLRISGAGPVVMERVQDISKSDDKTFTIVLKEPLGSLIEILATDYIFMMREQDASRAPTEQVTANIGSGPFKFNHALAKPGASLTYDRNEQYVPRRDPPNGFAGGKVVNVDRVIWDNIGDQQTALAALQAGEVDLLQDPPVDLFPSIESDPNIDLQVLNGAQNILLRMNALQKPFDNVKARQAMLHLIDQEAFAHMAVPDPRYTGTVTSLFGSKSPYSNDENTGWFKKGGDPERAKQLLQEAGYAGEKVVILQSTDVAFRSNAAQLLAATLRKIGVNAELAPSDWAGLVTRRANKGPVENGGWSIFLTDASDFSFRDPIGSAWLAPTGEKGFAGWVESNEFEALRAKWLDTGTLEERKALAREMQRVWWDVVPIVFMGQFVVPIARRKTLTGLISVPEAIVPMWNMQKA